MRNRISNRGFTLVELMIVVAVIGILAAIAVPQYSNYVTRARWSDNLQSVLALKTAIAECAQSNNGSIANGTCGQIADLQNGGFLPSNFTYSQGKYMAAVPTVDAGVISISGNELSANCTVTLSPVVQVMSLVRWDVTNSGTDCNRAKTGVGT